MSGTRDSCTCARCQAQCAHKPGWLIPRDVDRIAAYLGLSVEQLFSCLLVVDVWSGRRRDIYTLSPAIEHIEAGGVLEVSAYTGRCVFLVNGLCSIHEVKPYECRRAFHEKDGRNAHAVAMLAWSSRRHQTTIHDLLDEIHALRRPSPFKGEVL